jgi:AraC-like DNA-binding protein
LTGIKTRQPGGEEKCVATNKIAFYLARMAARNFTPEQVLARTRLTEAEVQQASFKASPAQYRAIIGNLIELTQDPFIGLKMGSEFKISYLGVLGYAALSSATLAQARETMSRYWGLNEYILQPANYVQDGKWYIEMTETFPLGNLLSFAIEEFITRTVQLSSSLTNRPIPIQEIRVSYAPPADMEPYRQAFNCPMFFNQPKNSVLMDPKCLEYPVSLADAEVFRLCEQQCKAIVRELEESQHLSEKIKNAMVRMPGHFPTLEEMAERLCISSRTLRRQLLREGVTYQQLMDNTRRDLAIQYLENTTLSPKEIGFLLGFSNVSNLRRAFKNWTGRKLSDYRE